MRDSGESRWLADVRMGHQSRGESELCGEQNEGDASVGNAQKRAAVKHASLVTQY